MKRRIKTKLLKYILSICIMLVFACTVFADEGAILTEVQPDGDTIYMYVQSAGEVTEASALVGSDECESISYEKISETNCTIDTMILIDNSLSIPKDSHDTIKTMLEELIANRASNERFSIATIGDNVQILNNEYSSDYAELKNIIENIEYKDQDTYLTNNLYQVLNDFQGDGSSYFRVLLVTDGVDDETLGYAQNEKTALFNSKKAPVYAVGIKNKAKESTERLNNLSSLCNLNNGKSIIMNAESASNDLMAMMAIDRNVVQFKVTIANESKDGSEKTVTLNCNGNLKFSADNIRMSAEKQEKVVEEKPKEEVPKVAPPVKVEEPPVEEPEEPSVNIVLIIGLVVGVIVIVLIVLLVLKKIKNDEKNNQFKKAPDVDDKGNIVKPAGGTSNGRSGSGGTSGGVSGGSSQLKKTVILGGDPTPDIKRTKKTVMLDAADRKYTIVLTDMDSPANRYCKGIDTTLVVGRLDDCDIVLDNETVSRNHCLIIREGNSFYIEDCGSGNKTFLDGNQVISKTEIVSGSELKLGRVRLKFEIE